jgi:hypothetical protein
MCVCYISHIYIYIYKRERENNDQVVRSCEGWPISEHTEEILRVQERKIFRKVYGTKWDTNGESVQIRSYKFNIEELI